MSTLFKNNAVSKLASGISIGATSLTVTAGQGDKFPVVVAPDVALVTLENASYNEIVKITARALGADTMTIVKAQEGTTDRAWLTGDTVSLRITAAQIQLGANAQDVAAAALAVHAAAADPHPTYTTAAELSTALAAYQPHDAQLDTLAAVTAQQATDLAALSTFMGTLLNDVDQATSLATLGALLNSRNAQTTAYSVTASDRGKLIDATTGTWEMTMNPATLGANFAFAARNSGTGVITLTPSTGTIDGAATAALNSGESCLVFCDGTNFKTVGHAGISAAYTSPTPATFAAGLIVAENHGLGSIPKAVYVAIRCVTPDVGYAAGDEINMSSFDAPGYALNTIWANATQVGFVNAYGTFRVCHKTTGAILSPTFANWVVVMRAFK